MNDHSRPGAKILPLLLIVVGLLLIGSVLAWQMVQAGKASASQSQAGESVDSSTPFPEIQRISLPEAKAAFDSKSAVFVDVRDSVAYNTAHIPGAVNIPLADIGNRSGELNLNQWIITYCT